MWRRPIITLASGLLALGAPTLALGYGGSGGAAAPVTMGGGLGSPEPMSAAPPPASDPAPPVELVVDARVVDEAGGSGSSGENGSPVGERTTPVPSPGQSSPAPADSSPAPAEPVSPAQAFAASPQVVLEPASARAAQTAIEPAPGEAPGQEDPFVPPPAPAPGPAEKPKAEAKGLPLSGAEFDDTVLLGVAMLAAGIAGLAASRAHQLSARPS
jgi:hypothetical protein